MPAKKAKRRTSGAHTSNKRPRTEVDDHVDMMVLALQTDLGNLAATPSACRMLAAGGHFALRLPVEERHELHHFVVDRIREVLATISAQLAGSADEARKQCTELEEASANLRDELETSANDFESARLEAEKQQENVESAEQDTKVTRKEHKLAADKVAVIQKRRSQWEKELARHQDNEVFNALVDGTCPEKDLRKNLDRLHNFFSSTGTEPALLASARHALATKKEERREFDIRTIEHLRTVQAANAARVESKIEGGEAEEATLVASLEDAAAAAEVKRTLVSEQEEKLAPLREIETEKFNRLKAAQDALQDHRTTYRKYTDSVESAETDICRFKVLDDAFMFLLKRSNAPMLGEEKVEPRLKDAEQNVPNPPRVTEESIEETPEANADHSPKLEEEKVECDHEDEGQDSPSPQRVPEEYVEEPSELPAPDVDLQEL